MKHKVIGLLAVYGLYSALGICGIWLRASEPAPQAPPAAPAPAVPNPPAVAPGQPVGIGAVGGLGKVGGPPGQPVGLGGFGKGGGFVLPAGRGQINGVVPIVGQPDLNGKKAVGIEDGPTKVLLATTPAPTPEAKDGFVNPKVEPGKVKWHADFDTACKAAAKSGKPVMLFQMMGKLDDQFC